MHELIGNEDLVVLIADQCDLCGRVFGEDEEFYLLKRVRRRGGFGQVVNEVAMCTHECGGQKVVKI